MANYGYKLMANPNPYSKRITCSAYGCDMKCGTNTFSEIKMFTFPRDPFRRRRWELATRRANWKSHSRSRICSKHFVTGRPSKDPTHPDYVPSIFPFNKNAQNSKSSLNQSTKKTRKKILATECTNPACENSSSDAGTFVPSSSGIKGFCSKCFSAESVSSAFSQSLEPLNQTLSQMMRKVTAMEEEREQLRNELALCRLEIHQLRESHRHCIRNPPSTSKKTTHSKTVSSVSVRSSSLMNETEVLDSSFSDDMYDDSELLPSQYLEQIYYQSDEASIDKSRLKKKLAKEKYSDDMISILDHSPKKKRVKSSSLESKCTSKSSKDKKSSDTSSPITIVYLKR